MKVGNPKAEQKSTESGKGGRSSSQTKTTRRKVTWPVTVSFRGKDFPSGIKLQYAYFGTEDGEPTTVGKGSQEVTLDEKGDFKLDLISPEAELVKTKKTVGGNRRGGGGKTVSEVKGTRITGCVIQLLVGDEVVRSFATKPTWAKLAKQNPLPEEEILKIR